MDAAPSGFLQAAPFLWTVGLLTLLSLGTISDLRHARIPNRLTYSAMIGGLLLQTAQHGVVGLSLGVAGLAVGMGLFLSFYVLGGMGAGDVKFMGAVGCMIGLPDILSAVLVTTLFGGAYAMGIMIRHKGVGKSLRDVWSLILACILTGQPRSALAPDTAQPKLRYGIVIALGTLAAQWWQGRL